MNPMFLSKELLVRNPFRKKLKVIEHNLGGIRIPDDTSYPYKVEISRAWPEFHRMAMIIGYGSDEHLIMRAATLRVVRRYIDTNRLRTDTLLHSCIVTGPNGEIERFGSEGR
jgi:hypothetical protein